ncbi:redox-sensitive transcriptional activator SoxR [Thiotrichales bacterium 19S3-7]|nr:redox-sensitive transcriptional activator SoxR [Thiotrichales bacterium 19S3-7]MCF6801591.1 redox-sensitive transcriptional activator SoxR [Thiotrichales bacterium 19S3-11]
MKKNSLLSVGLVAKRSGVSISTLHFYEEKNLIQSSRNHINQRQYSRDVLRRVAVIRAAKKIGLTLKEIKTGLSILPHGKSPSLEDWQKLATYWNTLLDTKIENLQNLRDSLTRCIGCGCLSLDKCPLYNKDDHLSKKGSGSLLLLMK